MNTEYSHLGALGPISESALRNEDELKPKYNVEIAKLLGLNSPRGTSVGVPSQNCVDEVNPYKISLGTGFSFDERYTGGGATTPPTPSTIARKKPYFETLASPEYSYNTESTMPRSTMNKRPIRTFASMRMESPVLDSLNGPRMMGNGRSDSPAGSGIGTPLGDHPFDDNVTNAMGGMKLGYYDYGNNNVPDFDFRKLHGGYGGLTTAPIVNSSLLQQMNQIYAKQQQQQHMLNQIFDDGWIGHQLRAGISLEKAARVHRTSAAMCNATCTWSGTLPQRSMHKPTSQFSCKVFLGGVPWDITESMLIGTFQQFGNARIEWPGKESDSTILPKGYVYIIFENDKQVKALLQACSHDHFNGGSWYYRISSRKMKAKEVQVIPWLLCDSNCVKAPSQKLDPQKTVFVGALHGMLNAEGLCHIMDELFGNVVYAGIDTDKFKYPIGSGRVTFSDSRSYMRAVAAAFIDIKTAKFAKKVQVDPYLEDALCSMCHIQQGPYFCREMTCFRYFCRVCWQCSHSADTVCNHKPLMRNSKTGPSMLGFSAGMRSSN